MYQIQKHFFLYLWATVKTRRQHLFKKARSNVKSTRLQKKRIQREMKKKTPNINKFMKWQKKIFILKT